MTTPDLASHYANQAAEVAGKLKHGSYDAVQALAFVSIAQSLARIAAHMEQQQQRPQGWPPSNTAPFSASHL